MRQRQISDRGMSVTPATISAVTFSTPFDAAYTVVPVHAPARAAP
ncbi:MAG: hypothetical protein ACRELX_16450 [Longimicrobiales bacterium]